MVYYSVLCYSMTCNGMVGYGTDLMIYDIASGAHLAKTILSHLAKTVLPDGSSKMCLN